MPNRHFEKLTLFLLIFSFFIIPINGIANTDSTQTIARIQPGAVEIGASGSLTSIDGVSEATIFLHSQIFKAVSGKSLVGVGGEVGFAHIRSFDQLDIQGNISWQQPFANSAIYYFFLLGGGLRFEWLGSFRETLYPAGGNIGIYALISQWTAFRFDYRFQRIFGNPISNFNEHRFMIGISVFLRNK